jgi:predicted nucleic acid-binding protein
MPFVLGASIAACLAFEDEDHLVAAPALERIRTEEARAPSLWWFEVRNTLIVNERRGRLTEADVAAFPRALSRLGITLDRAPDEAAVLALARREGIPLGTLDTGLAEAARAENLPLIGAA